jgi:hypothetical protein
MGIVKMPTATDQLGKSILNSCPRRETAQGKKNGILSRVIN